MILPRYLVGPLLLCQGQVLQHSGVLSTYRPYAPGCARVPAAPLRPTRLFRVPPHAPPQATLAACNVAATLQGYPAWTQSDVLPFVDGPFADIPKAAPSIVNAKELNLKTV